MKVPFQLQPTETVTMVLRRHWMHLYPRLALLVLIAVVPPIAIWAAVGGRGTLIGPIVGAFFVNGAKSWFTQTFPEYWLYFLGALFIAVTLFLPQGLVGLVAKLRGRKPEERVAVIRPALPTKRDCLALVRSLAETLTDSEPMRPRTRQPGIKMPMSAGRRASASKPTTVASPAQAM